MPKISDVRAGPYTMALLENGVSSRQAERTAATRGLELIALYRYCLTA
jgi:GntR family transcriptional regulator / MocR family aminotransferase